MRNGDWDTIVIGSGAGGLTAATALANHGQRVLVLEQHYLPGGWMQSFSLGGYRFSPGIHYIGECGPGGSLRNLYEGLGVAGDLELCEMSPDGYDHLQIGDERIDVPRGWERWQARLIERFPHERRGIVKYFDICQAVARDIARLDHLLGFPQFLALPFFAPHLLRWGFATQGALLDATVKDPLLRGFLTAQNGDHGLPPSRVSLPVHACTIAHYANGAYYPRGGGKSIPRALIRRLQKNGGAIRVRARVKSIVVENGRAAGVTMESGERLRARNVISNADPRVTYHKLLPPDLCPKEYRKSTKMRYSTSVVSLFAATDLDLRGRGFDSGNYWYYANQEVGAAYERAAHSLPRGEIESLFLAITTLKDPGHARRGHHTLEMFTFLPHAPFSAWEGTAQGKRGQEYEVLKESLGKRLLAAAEKIIPGLSRALLFCEVATPVTNTFYCETPFGSAYGTEKTPSQLGPFSYRTRSELEGLSLCGASTLSHGVAGASISGLMAAQHVLGAKSKDDLLMPPDGSLRVFPSDHPEEWLPGISPSRERGSAGETACL